MNGKSQLDDFSSGYNYARRRYRELAEGCGRPVLLELAATLGRAEGEDAEAARGIARAIEEMARAEEGE